MLDNLFTMKYANISIEGARQHNLKNINVEIPKNKLVVITGVSGSGKSSLAFDTIFAEGQRRYVDTLSPYARQFLNMMQRPDVDKIEGLGPTIAIGQKSISRKPRSTVGTITDIYDYLRLLYARIGTPYSPNTGLPMKQQSRQQIIEYIMNINDNQHYYIMAPIAIHNKCNQESLLKTIESENIQQICINNDLYSIDSMPNINPNITYNISLVLSKMILTGNTNDNESKLKDEIERALSISGGIIIIKNIDTQEETMLSEVYICQESGFCIEKIEPRLFSFNNQVGACLKCGGLGYVSNNDKEDDSYDETHRFQARKTCAACNGDRLCQKALCVLIDDMNISQVSQMTVEEMSSWLGTIVKNLSESERAIIEKTIIEIQKRLQFIINVGLEYLTVARQSETLSGGESQRIRLASQIGSGLTGVIYVLDEPSIGLHQRDNHLVISALKKLRDSDNTVIVVEHDDIIMNESDWIIDIGPNAGIHGGEVIACGTIEDIKKNPNSITGRYLSNKEKIDIQPRKALNMNNCIEIKGACKNNLKNINVKFPLHGFVCVTGVSGSGKSTLVLDLLYNAVHNAMLKKQDILENNRQYIDSISGIENISDVINISQAPIGKTPRSNPITYVGCFADIREIFAKSPLAQQKQYASSRFSFNVSGGRCALCKGDGVIKVEMHFFPDIYITCEQCKGARFNQDTIAVKYKGYSISDVLNMTINDGAKLFQSYPAIFQKLNCLKKVGVGYLTIGHKATILSGGEAQRIKLAKELSKQTSNNTLYILDEPTTGLHMDDVKKLLEILHLLVKSGNSVIVIEHNIDVIKTADWVIDIGPEAGKNGGNIVCEGTPEQVAKCEESHTGRYLREYLDI